MKLNNYSVRVVGTKGDVREHEGYVLLPDQTNYSLKLRNYSNRECEAEITIDGKIVGTWLMYPQATINIERPVSEAKKFIFLLQGSLGFAEAGLNKISNESLGLVSVRFTPEKVKKPTLSGVMVCNGTVSKEYGASSDWSISHASSGSSTPFLRRSRGGGQSTSYNAPGAACASTPGGTGLRDKSEQEFKYVQGLDLSVQEAVTINLRLVGLTEKDEDYHKITELKPLSSPIPPPIW